MAAERTVRFLELLGPDGGQIAPLDWDAIISHVVGLSDEDAVHHVRGMVIQASAYRATPGATARSDMIMLDRLTKDPSQRIAKGRKYRPIPLGPDEALSEPTHFAFFDRNVIGIMRSGQSSPGPAAFRDWLNLNFSDPDHPSDEYLVHSLVDPQALRALGDVDRLTRFHVEVSSDAALDAFPDGGFVREALRITRERVGSVQVSLEIKLDPKAASEGAEAALDEVRNIVTGAASASLLHADMGYRDLENFRAQSYDFLNERLSHSVDVEIDAERGWVTDSSAAAGLSSAYDAIYDDVLSALNRS